MARIMLVQPEATLRRTMARTIAAAGHSIIPMTTSHEAAATAEAFDVGVVDLELPDGSGLHLAARLSGFGRLRGRVFTASQLESAVARRAAPMGPVVVRGAPAAVLLDAIDRVLAAMDRAAETMRSGVRPSAPVHPWPFASGAAGSKQS